MNGFINYLTYFGISEMKHKNEFDFCTKTGKIRSSFIFLESGTAEYETENSKFSLSAGDMIFIPCGAKYSSHFRGENIRYKNFICVFSPDSPSNAQNSAVFPMQVINYLNIVSSAELDGI